MDPNKHRSTVKAYTWRNPIPPTPIAIIGVSGRYPGGATSPSRLWDVLRTGADAVGEAKGDRWDLGYYHPDPEQPGRVYTKAGGFLDSIDGFDAEFFGMSPREAKQVDPQQRLLPRTCLGGARRCGVGT